MICFIINFIGISFYFTMLCYCLQRAKTWGRGLIFTCYELPKFMSSQELMIYGLRAFIFKIHFRDFSSALSPVIPFLGCQSQVIYCINVEAQIAKFMRPPWGPPGSCRPQVGPMLAPWTLLSGRLTRRYSCNTLSTLSPRKRATFNRRYLHTCSKVMGFFCGGEIWCLFLRYRLEILCVA